MKTLWMDLSGRIARMRRELGKRVAQPVGRDFGLSCHTTGQEFGELGRATFAASRAGGEAASGPGHGRPKW